MSPSPGLDRTHCEAAHMRAELCAALVARAERPNMVFLTGDLGFMALEPLRDRMGARFINCGIGEQNMVSVAAGLAREGLETWVYTIAPFCYARAFEQIRNDICLHGLPVRLLGNGGGYGYGVMGPTHHALEDYGVLLTLPGMTVYVPAFNEDVAAAVERAAAAAGPAYIRLGRGELPGGSAAPSYAPWRCLAVGSGPVVVVVGPLAGSAMAALADLHGADPVLWVATELPLAAAPPPALLAAQIAAAGRLCVIEEHVGQGGLGAMLATWTLESGIALRGFRHLHAHGYPSGRYGSQAFHRRESGLDPDSIRHAVLALAT
jgi:transketolase